MSDTVQEVLDNQLVVINLGLVKFSESLETQGVEVIHVDWTPPADGDQEMIDLLDALL